MSKAKTMGVNWVTENQKLLVDVHQKIWEYAEVGLQEIKTSKLLTSILEKEGFQVEKEVANMPSAFVATYGQGTPVIGIMVELDALPSISQKPVPSKAPL
ncbi:MAG: hypothetical protein ACXAEX_21950 [Promethearchaeota archaeon]|jgi:aminobenzoyl-glutamate utilization protein B